MLTIEELDAFQQIKLDEVDIDTLVDLNSVKIDTSLPVPRGGHEDKGILFKYGQDLIRHN